MGNPLAIATKGKGFFPMLSRAGKIAKGYGFTSKKMDRVLAELTATLKEFDCPATFPVTASALARNPVLARKVMAQGVELAVHGYTHIDYTQHSVDQQRDHFRRSLEVFEKNGFSPTGFRCPYLRWNKDTLQALGECGFRYDSSQALVWDVVGNRNNDAYAHVMEFYGAQLAVQHPSLPRFERGIVRIPYCLPDDEALVERLKLPSGAAMSEIWLTLLERIYAAGEVFTLGLHPERALQCEEALRAVLARARSLSPAVWITRLDDIAAWYQGMAQVSFTAQPQGGGQLHLTVCAPTGAVLLARSVEIEAPAKAWAQGYEQVLSNELNIRSEQHPWIGLAPDSPTSLRSFLQHQGYLVEISTDSRRFSYYFSQKNFQAEDERPILTEIESGNQPLLRLGRWPNGARAALAVTGDVDAFTLWDYGMRVFNR